jgi:hypothetical protein
MIAFGNVTYVPMPNEVSDITEVKSCTKDDAVSTEDIFNSI